MGTIKINKQQLVTSVIAGIVTGLVVIWLQPLAKKLPPRENKES